MARLFFAIWPDAPAREALAAEALRLADRLEGRAVPAGKIHLTLAFLGEVEARTDDARAVAAALRQPPFALRFDRVGAFRRTGVAWAGMERPPSALVTLQAALETRLRSAGFDLEERPFAPHVTLARRISRPLRPAPIAPIEWSAQGFALVRSDTATGRYEPIEEWKLET